MKLSLLFVIKWWNNCKKDLLELMKIIKNANLNSDAKIDWYLKWNDKLVKRGKIIFLWNLADPTTCQRIFLRFKGILDLWEINEKSLGRK